MFKRISFALIAISILSACGSPKNQTAPGLTPSKTGLTTFRLAFYNLENLFDTIDGPNDDSEYLPTSEKPWNTQRYQSKLKNMARVIDSIQPQILGVCEIENQRVLIDLIKTSTWLTKIKADVVHFESPDKRGIDVAVIKSSQWMLSASDTLWVSTGNPEKPTRHILMATLKNGKSEVSIFVNHWPSRSGGELSTRPLRFNAAKTLKDYIDARPNMKNWVAVGDFNDNPEDSSMRYILGASDEQANKINLAFLHRLGQPETGTLKYNGLWDMFDQIIVSRSLYHLGPENPIPQIQIYNRPWLLQQDGKYQGYPLRTFGGRTYLNGYSDHLPVFVDLSF